MRPRALPSGEQQSRLALGLLKGKDHWVSSMEDPSHRLLASPYSWGGGLSGDLRIPLQATWGKATSPSWPPQTCSQAPCPRTLRSQQVSGSMPVLPCWAHLESPQFVQTGSEIENSPLSTL